MEKSYFILSSLEYSISLGEDVNSHMPSSILTYPFQNNLSKLCISTNFLGQFWLTHIVNFSNCFPLLQNIDKLQKMHDQNICPKNFLPNTTHQTYNPIQGCNHNVQIISLILDVSNNFSPRCIIVQQLCQVFGQGLSTNIYRLKKVKGNVLWLAINSLKINHQCKNIMSNF